MIVWQRFVNGSLNAAYNCLDVHVKNGHGEQVAVIHDSPLTNTIEKVTYKQLLNEVLFIEI
jgi:propionyl-CoA synthetase